MTGRAGEGPVTAQVDWKRLVRRIAVGYLVVHVLLILSFDLWHPDALLEGDRAIPRMGRIERFLDSGSWEVLTHRLFTYGVPGDYLWQATVLKVGGITPYPRAVLVLVQVILSALSIPLVARLAHMLVPRPQVPVIAALAYALLPSSTAFPHLLVSEAWSVPLGIAGTWLFFSGLRKEGRGGTLALSGVCWVVAVLTRPNVVLVFLVFAPLLLLRARASVGARLGFLAAPVLLLSIWAIGTILLTGRVTVSGGHPAMHEQNLYDRAQTLISSLDPDDRAVEQEWLERHAAGRLPTSEFMGLLVRHAVPAARLFALEGAKLVLRANETKVLNYLGVWEAPPKWGAEYLRDPVGLMRKQGWIGFVVLAGTLVWMCILFTAGYGVYLCMRARGKTWVVLLLLSVALVAGAFTVEIQGRHRYPADFVVVSFFAVGLTGIRPPFPSPRPKKYPRSI